MRSGASLWNRLVLCADLYEFLADIRSDRLSELQLSPVLSLNDEELTQKPEEILVSTSELTGFMELSTALGSCRPIGACTFPTGIGNSSAVPPHELFHSILLCSLTDRVCPQQYRSCSDTVSGSQGSPRASSALWGDGWTVGGHLHCLNALVIGHFP